MEKLIFPVARKPRTKVRSTAIRVSPEAYNAVEALSAKTGLSNSYIASQLILFAYEHCDVSYTEED